jgi:hypothetical protein
VGFCLIFCFFWKLFSYLSAPCGRIWPPYSKYQVHRSYSRDLQIPKRKSEPVQVRLSSRHLCGWWDILMQYKYIFQEYWPREQWQTPWSGSIKSSLSSRVDIFLKPTQCWVSLL